jgi:hypothetical protein
MPEHLAATLQRVCWVGFISLTPAPYPPSMFIGPESQNRGKSHQSQKNEEMRSQVGLGCRGQMVKTSGWRSFDRQFEPYPRAIKAAP